MRKRIDLLRWHHVGLSKRFLGASNGDIFDLDLVFLGVMVRSYSLVDGFIDAFDAWNPIVAAPLVRMQIDNLVRLSYLARAPKADDVARYVIAGGEFRKRSHVTPDGSGARYATWLTFQSILICAISSSESPRSPKRVNEVVSQMRTPSSLGVSSTATVRCSWNS